MPLGKIQSQIVAALEELGRLNATQVAALAAHPDDLSGEALGKVLADEYAVPAFHLLVARARAARLAPFNAHRHKVSPQTFARLSQEFCQEHLVLPVGEVGELLLVAVANPFDLALPVLIQEMTGRKVVRLLAREKDIRDKFSKDQGRVAGFDDVMEQIDDEFGGGEGITGTDEVTEESGPIIQLANRIIEDAYYSGTSDIHLEPWEKELVIRNRIDGVCHEKLRLPGKVGPALVARLKIMC